GVVGEGVARAVRVCASGDPLERTTLEQGHAAGRVSVLNQRAVLVVFPGGRGTVGQRSRNQQILVAPDGGGRRAKRIGRGDDPAACVAGDPPRRAERIGVRQGKARGVGLDRVLVPERVNEPCRAAAFGIAVAGDRAERVGQLGQVAALVIRVLPHRAVRADDAHRFVVLVVFDGCDGPVRSFGADRVAVLVEREPGPTAERIGDGDDLAVTVIFGSWHATDLVHEPYDIAACVVVVFGALAEAVGVLRDAVRRVVFEAAGEESAVALGALDAAGRVVEIPELITAAVGPGRDPVPGVPVVAERQAGG